MAVQDRYPDFVADQREMFDALITEDWETYHNADWDAVRRYEVARLFDHVHPATVLDIGCGCGFHDQVMGGYDFVHTIHAIDYSEKSIERANEAYPHPKVTRWVADLQADEPAQRYDLVVSFQVFEHLADPAAYFRFCKRAVASDGRVAILTPNRTRLSNALRMMKGQAPQFCDPQHFREYSLGDLRALATDHGLAVTSWFGYGMNGMRWIDRAPIARRLALGARLPWIASGICVLMHPPASSE